KSQLQSCTPAPNAQRRELNRNLSEMKRAYEHQLDQGDRAREAQSRAHEEALRNNMKDQTEKVREVHEKENQHLRAALRSSLNVEKDWLARHGDARATAVKELETDWNVRQNSMQNAYEGEIDHLKKSAKASERAQFLKQDEVIRERDEVYTNLIRNQNSESLQRIQDMAKNQERNQQQLFEQNQHDRKLHDAAYEAQAEKAEITRESALAKQASQYQEAFKRQKDTDATELRRLQQSIQDLNTSERPSSISPTAENAIRKSMIREYEKTMDAEKDRNRRALAGTHENQTNRYQDLVQDKESREATLQRDHAFETQQQKQELMGHIGDLELSRNIERRNSEADQSREVDNIRRSYENMLNRQRREYEDILEKSRIDSQNKFSAYRQDTEFAMKMAHRDFNAKESNMVREYERKSETEKLALMDQIQAAKEEAQKVTQESNRQIRQVLDETTRSYEQRMKQLEAQHKERERFLSQNFEDEMEKMKRSYALLLQKKG
ncbi:MAG: hypothetical protein AABZ55_15525, partial [Bdellovibrionota bacterium]